MAEAGWFFIHGSRLRRKLKEAGAVSEETAKTIEELNLNSREIRTLKRNVWIGKVKEVTDEKGVKRYYVPCEE
jgi:SOS response regulatory protein OraA/RecX